MAILFPAFLMLVMVASLAESKASIDDIPALFQNTITKWDVKVGDKRDLAERYARLVTMKRDLDMTTSGGELLDHLNRYSVNNDEEHETLMGKMRKRRAAAVAESDEVMLPTLAKRSDESTDLPLEYEYWEKTLGLQEPVGDQLGCGACWAFPQAVALQALYKNLTGEEVDLSEQFLIDCASEDGQGCEGGTSKEAYEFIINNNNFIASEEELPYEGYNIPCEYSDEDMTAEKSALKLAWVTYKANLPKEETTIMTWLLNCPISMITKISETYMSYYGTGLFEDNLSPNIFTHAQLLVGYTENSFRLRGSYGTDWGDNGYINYKRSTFLSSSVLSTAHMVGMAKARDIQYAFCNDAAVATWTVCRESCLAMNSGDETGWDLAVIPTNMHNEQVRGMADEMWPGVKSKDKFNYLWIGLYNPEKGYDSHYWLGEVYSYQYNNWEYATDRTMKYTLINKNTGEWISKNSETFSARGVCSKTTDY